MRYLLTILALIPLLASSQTVMPNAILDTMIWEVSRGRQCDSLQRKQQTEIEALGAELVANQDALKMQVHQTETCESLVTNVHKETGLVKQQSAQNERKLKKRIVTLGKVAIAELGIILILIL